VVHRPDPSAARGTVPVITMIIAFRVNAGGQARSSNWSKRPQGQIRRGLARNNVGLPLPAISQVTAVDDQFGTHTVGTGAVGARLLIGSLIGLLIGGLIANSQARRDARALDQSPHRWAAEAVRWCAASSPAAAHRSSALGGSATCSVVVRSRVSARPCGSRCRVPPARRDVGRRPASNTSRFCGLGRS
jgi:hypothetical protein